MRNKRTDRVYVINIPCRFFVSQSLVTAFLYEIRITYLC